ncbi:MAG: cation-transporting P-type ATPase [Bacilli bacterium]|nr:cation-transporting P-type ATPase [Bacilli bacterium]
MKDYYNKTKEEIFNEFDVTEDGLSNSKANKLLEKYGKNELPKKKQESIFKLFFSQFKDPMELILVFTVVLSFIVGETFDAIALIIIILVDVILGTIEEWKAKKDADALLNMIKVESKVMRNGKEIVIDSSLLVPGDVVLLESGDKISIDGRIIECHNFQVDESSLTGESVGIIKNKDKLKGEVLLADRKNMVFAGTSVITGRAKVVVTHTASHTEIGKIAVKVNNTEDEKSPLTIRMEKFIRQISVVILIIALITTFVLVQHDYKVNEIFVCVIALAVSAMPEGLNLALTMALTIASKRMAKKNVIVKKLNAVESLGSCTVIASDKTGTLTVNEQTAKEIVLADGSMYMIGGTGYNDNGKVEPVGKAKLDKAKEIAMLGALNTEAHLDHNDDGTWEFFGDSIDIAFLSLAKKMNIVEYPDISEIIPYESENQYSAVFYKKGKDTYCTVKGSLEKVMAFSKEDEKYKKQNIELTKRGYRVIAIANGKVNGHNKEDIKNLDFVGMVAFIDPIRVEVKQSIRDCRNAGIKVVMITGDHPLTALSIAKDLGLVNSDDQVATGVEVQEARSKGEIEFDEFVKSKRVFSRVTPMDKLEIVNSFKRQGEFVAVTGDGVNDAPAIKSANIGIAMGSGTDVAKETASIIVADDNFTSIVDGIREGRCAYSNIRKISLFLLGCGFAEIAFFLLSIAFGYEIPLVAIQLLWLNMVTDGFQDISLSLETCEDDIMKEKPRDTKESLFNKDLILGIAVLGTTITIIVFGTWLFMMKRNYNLVTARSIIMMLMVIIQNINVLNCRSEKKSLFSISLKTNPLLIVTIIGSILLQVVLAEIDITAKFLNVEPISWLSIMEIFGLSFIIIVVFEVYKYIRERRNHIDE